MAGILAVKPGATPRRLLVYSPSSGTALVAILREPQQESHCTRLRSGHGALSVRLRAQTTQAGPIATRGTIAHPTRTPWTALPLEVRNG